MPSTSGASTSTEGEAPSPSPLAGEGARRADEGWAQVAHHRPVAPRQRSFARRLRRHATEEEVRLWSLLRDRRFAEYNKFRRQVPIGRYIVDFACLESRLIVELDGSQHAESARDVVRDTWLERQHFRIVRVWNRDLTHARHAVLDAIWYALQPEGDPA